MTPTPAIEALLRDPAFLAQFQQSAQDAIASPLAAIQAPERPPARHPRPDRPDHLKCVDKKAARNQRSDRTIGIYPVNCGQCEICREWRAELIVRRYELEVKPGQELSIIRVTGLPDVDMAAEWRARFTQLGGKRVSIVGVHEIIFITTSNVTERDLRLDRRRATAQGLPPPSLEHRPLRGAEFASMVPREPLADGAEKKRRTLVFSNWQGFDEKPDDFRTVQLGIDTNPPVLQRYTDDRSAEVRSIDREPDLNERRYRNNALRATWGNVHPHAAEMTMEWAAGLAEWEEWMRPTLLLLGIDEKEAPLERCRGCDLPPIPGQRLCVVCELARG